MAQMQAEKDAKKEDAKKDPKKEEKKVKLEQGHEDSEDITKTDDEKEDEKPKKAAISGPKDNSIERKAGFTGIVPSLCIYKEDTLFRLLKGEQVTCLYYDSHFEVIRANDELLEGVKEEKADSEELSDDNDKDDEPDDDRYDDNGTKGMEILFISSAKKQEQYLFKIFTKHETKDL